MDNERNITKKKQTIILKNIGVQLNCSYWRFVLTRNCRSQHFLLVVMGQCIQMREGYFRSEFGYGLQEMSNVHTHINTQSHIHTKFMHLVKANLLHIQLI